MPLARTHQTASELAVRHRQAALVSGGETSITRDASFVDCMMQSIVAFDWLTHTQPAMHEHTVFYLPEKIHKFLSNSVTKKFIGYWYIIPVKKGTIDNNMYKRLTKQCNC